MLKQPTIFPPNKTWNEPNTGFLFGSLYQTQNISLDVAGVLSLSKRARYIGRTATSGSPRLGYVLSIQFDGQGQTGSVKYYYVGSDGIYDSSQALGSFGLNAVSSPPTTLLASTDAVIWTDGLYVSTTNNVSKLSSGAWTGSQMSFSNSGVPHPLTASASANYLLGGDGHLVQKKDPSTGTVTLALTLPINYRVQWIRSDYSRTLIGCRNMNGGNTAVFEWDEVAPTWTNKYDVDCSWVYSGVFRNTDFFVVTNDGRLLKFNGGGFSLAAQWPIYKTLEGDWVNGFSLGTVFQRGMAVVDGKIQIMLNAEVNNGYYYPNFPSGVWEFDEATGLNHKYGATYSDDATDFSQGQYPTGAGAIAPIVIDPITGGPDPAVGSSLIFGARVTGPANDYYTVSSLTTTSPNRGFFVTTRIETADIADNQRKLWVKFRGLFNSSDKMIFKIKERVVNGIPFNPTQSITWVTTTQFTTDAADAAGWALVSVKDEVTILRKGGAGAAANITAISAPSAGVYTIDVDEVMPGIAAAEVTDCIVDNFRRLETEVLHTDEYPYKGIPLEQTNPSDWIQVKGEMRGSYLVTLEEMQVVSASQVLPTP